MDDELIIKLQETHRQSQEIEEKFKVVEQQLDELQKFASSLEDLGKNSNKEILASLGKGVYIKSDIKDEKLFVDVGSGILVRKSIEESRQVVEEQSKKLNEMKIQLVAENETIAGKMGGLIEKVEEFRE